MIKLPDVTLVVAETRVHELARMAVEACKRQVEFGAVVVYTDDPDKIAVAGARVEIVEDWPTKRACGEFSTFDVGRAVETSHLLFLEWDGGVVDASMWSDGFLAYDFVGSPWWYRDGLNVGNGGFALRSKRLTDFLSINRDRMPAYTDELLCRNFRREIEAATGYRWAPENVAHRFAFECSPPHATFGFHAMRNWPHVLDRDELVRRTKVAVGNPYSSGPSHLGQLLGVAPWLRQEIGP